MPFSNPAPASRASAALLVLCASLYTLPATAQPVEVWRNNSDWRQSNHLWRNYTESRQSGGLMQDFSFMRLDTAEEADPRSPAWAREQQYLAAVADPAKRLAYARQHASQDKGRGHYLEAACYVVGDCGVKPDLAQAMAAARRGTAAGHLPSMVLLGQGLVLGRGVAANPKEGLEWLRRAAERGDREACFLLGQAAYRGRGMKQDFVQARDWLLKAAELPAAAGLLGTLYGWLLPQTDAALEARYLRQAAEGGDLLGAAWWGERLLTGNEHVKKDKAGARLYLKRAADAGIASAMAQWADLLRQGDHADGARPEPQQARALLEAAAAEGDPRALYAMGEAHQEGWLGWPASATAAEPWMVKAAAAGQWQAMGWLTSYHHAAGRAAEARRYNDMAVQAGSPRGYYNRGMAEWEGLWGYIANDQRALSWFVKSAEAGYAEGHRMAARLLLTSPAAGNEGPRGCRHALAAAEATGARDAMVWTGQCLEFGLGGTTDLPKAIDWYRRAAAAGSESAQRQLTRLGVR